MFALSPQAELDAAAIAAAFIPAPIAPSPDRSCPCNPDRHGNPDECGCPGSVRMGDCCCYRYLFEHPDLWSGWPYRDEIAAFAPEGEPVDLTEARRRSAAVVAAAVGA